MEGFERKMMSSNRVKAAVFIMLLMCLLYALSGKPGEPLTGTNIIVPAIIALYCASALSCLFTLITARIFRVKLLAVSIGTLPALPIYRIGKLNICVGLLPFPDRFILEFAYLSNFRRECLHVIPQLLMCGVFCVLQNIRYSAPELEMFNAIGLPLYSFIALLALACLAVTMVDILLIFSKYADFFPPLKGFYSFLLFIFAGAFFWVIYNLWPVIKTFVYDGW